MTAQGANSVYIVSDQLGELGSSSSHSRGEGGEGWRSAPPPRQYRHTTVGPQGRRGGRRAPSLLPTLHQVRQLSVLAESSYWLSGDST